MKITFPDKSYIELIKSNHPEKVIITIVAKNNENPLETIANSVEITVGQMKELVSSLNQ